MIGPWLGEGERTNLPLASPHWPSRRCQLAREFRRLTPFSRQVNLASEQTAGLQTRETRGHVTSQSLGGRHLDTTAGQLVSSSKAEAVSGNWSPDQEGTRRCDVAGNEAFEEGVHFS